jgi:pathogenesis-related protein 1
LGDGTIPVKKAFRVALRVALVAVSLAGLANAQDVAANQRASIGSGQARVTADVEPAGLSGMLEAQNQLRTRLGLDTLTWSAELSASAAATAREASEGACSMGSTERALRDADVSLYWAAAIRRFGGEDAMQDISSTYVVSRWREGRSAYDVDARACRNSSTECAAYARIVAAANREVGCARMRCPSSAQVWICQYGE